MRGCLILAVILAGIAVFVAVMQGFTESRERRAERASPPPTGHPEDGIRPVNLTVENASWRVDGISIVCDFSIVNRRRYPVKDVGIRVAQFAQSGSLLRSENVIQYQVWQSGDALDFRGIRCGIAHRQCAAVTVELSGFWVDLKP